ncbi:ABC transporter substrate-binding protein [Phytoactinopolyspora halotolerans]|uniref:Probable sugar-binding periplasmic protein n=1 Tax=Phytoactinopolyspora halotolerans TaxID=1981512 RepID=A0A6L9S458_9ACTN|nr:ABC transporter substrate-binding protein [Phytoactinopolyspora halotolerans]NED99257.1 carbohydrate ABC transporter substrate-binding protein [Phytoactinopolyspora halotolerans]
MRRMSWFASVAAVALVLTACGDDDNESTTEGSGGSEEEASGEVEVFTWWTEGGEKAGLDGLVSVFSEQCSDFEFVNGAVAGGAGSNAKQVLASRLQTGEPPDTFQAHAGGELLDYINADQLEDLSGLYDEWGLSDSVSENLLDAITLDGAIYSVPANVHRANVVWANPTVLEDAGLPAEAPASVDDWLADMQTLRDNGVDAPLAIATDWTQTMLLEAVLIAELGPEAYTGLYDGSTDWASAEVPAALEKYGQMLEFANADRAGLDWPDAVNKVTAGDAAYTLMGDWAAGKLDADGLELDTDYVWWPSPGTDGVFQWLADSFVLPVGAPNRAGTECWLEVVGSEDGQREFNTAKGSIPARTDADPSDYGPYAQAAMEDWASDALAPSLAHGSAAPVGWIDAVNSAVGQFSTSGDVGALQEQLAAAAQ